MASERASVRGSIGQIFGGLRRFAYEQPLQRLIPRLVILILGVAFLGATLTSTEGLQALVPLVATDQPLTRSDLAAWASALGTFFAAVVALGLGWRAERTTLTLERKREEERERERQERAHVLAAALIPALSMIGGTAQEAESSLAKMYSRRFNRYVVPHRSPPPSIRGLDVVRDRLPDVHNIKNLGVDVADLYASCMALNIAMSTIEDGLDNKTVEAIRGHLSAVMRHSKSLTDALLRLQEGMEDTIDYVAVRRESMLFGDHRPEHP
ncbi:hypothetical protein [Teichococcus cervicalis]|uniref:Uncharacterized protein n=2 Tax=Teichococcus cervicalis TaxID=204525 RepID=D5RM68_9PROT|nr:hypothetical protein [Pseudoroseomonas cervicalis]EFH11620.1 hypothetical protein HMPREF0731_2179 [Pseudoroseomonas cervicalis ATCC 49957]